MSPTENCSRTRSLQKNISQKTLGWAMPGNLDSSLQFPGVFSLFSSSPFRATFVPLHRPYYIYSPIPWNTYFLPWNPYYLCGLPTAHVWNPYYLLPKPLLSIIEPLLFMPGTWNTNFLSWIWPNIPTVLTDSLNFLGLAERHQTISCVWQA